MNDYDLVKPLRRILSYGGGVQTFALLLLIQKGSIPKPSCLIFSDTGCEWPHTYKHIEEVAKPICLQLGIPFITVMHKEGLIPGYSATNSIPMAGFRSCTYHYKVRPIHKYIKETWPLEKVDGKPSFISLIGISTDESKRAVSREDQLPLWMVLEYPLLELNLSRQDCLDLIEESIYPLAQKSGCFLCPYSSTSEWAKLKREQPKLMQIAIDLEQKYRIARPYREAGLMGTRNIWLTDFNSLSSILEYIDSDFEASCDSKQGGGCFI